VAARESDYSIDAVWGWFGISGGIVCTFYSSRNKFSYSTTQKSPLNKLLSKSPRINGEENNINKPLNNTTRIGIARQNQGQSDNN
jgi:hypothetical protein